MPQNGTQEQLDPSIVNLAQAISKTETAGQKNPYTAKGGSGEYGAYQYTAPTWQADSQKYLGQSVKLEDSTPEQQDRVAYNKIKDLGSQGHNPSQIASIWNSGKPDPTGNVGVNKQGIKYDTPQYVKSVESAYNQIRSGVKNPETTPTASTVGNETTGTPTTSTDTGNPLVNFAKGVGNFLFPIVGDVKDVVTGENKKSGVQIAADLGLSLLTFVPGIGWAGKGAQAAKLGVEGASLAAKAGGWSALLKMAGIGATAGGLGAISEGGGLKEAAKGAVTGGLVGGALGGVGQILTKAAGALPERIAGSILTKASPDTVKYAIEKGLGSPTKMLTESKDAIKILGNNLGEVLSHPQYAGLRVSAEEVLPKVIERFPNAGLAPNTIVKKLMQVVPNQKTLIEKLVSKTGLTLDELHTLNSDLGANTFKTVFDNPAVKAGKDVASAFYHSASDIIKTKAPETEQLFSQLSREYPLRTALEQVVRRGQKAKTFNLRDLMALIAGFSAAGPVGAGLAYGGEKLLTSPTSNLKVAGLVSRLGRSQLLKKGGQYAGLVSSRLAGSNQ